MSDLQGRSQRTRRSGNQAPGGRAFSGSSKGSTSGGSARKRRRRPPENRLRRDRQAASDYQRGQRQRDRSSHAPQSTQRSFQQEGGLVQNSPGAIVKANPSFYRSRDGRHVPLGPDTSRQRPQIGAYAPAFKRNPAHYRKQSPNYRQSATHPVPYETGQIRRTAPAVPVFSEAETLNYQRPPQRLNPRPVSRQRRTGKLARVPEKPKKETTALVYVVRLLILGIGIGVIAGTMISFFKPIHLETGTAQAGQPVSGIDSSQNGSPLGNDLIPTAFGNRNQSLATPMQVGQELIGLRTNLENLTSGYSGLTPGVFLYDLNTTNYLSLNGERIFSAASTIKVPILVAFFQDVEAGRLSLNDVWTMHEYDVGSGSGDMQYEPVGTQYSALTVATKMIVISDNSATNILVRQLGGAHALNERFQSWGLTSTVIRNPLPDLDGTNTTSPKDMVTLMKLVSDGELLPIQFRDQMLRIMERTKTRTLLPQGIGPDAQIAHKTGDIGLMVGDVGLIDMPSGKRYALTALVQRPHNDPRAQEMIRQISRMAYESLESDPSAQDVPNFQLPQTETGSAGSPEDSARPNTDNPAFFNGAE